MRKAFLYIVSFILMLLHEPRFVDAKNQLALECLAISNAAWDPNKNSPSFPNLFLPSKGVGMTILPPISLMIDEGRQKLTINNEDPVELKTSDIVFEFFTDPKKRKPIAARGMIDRRTGVYVQVDDSLDDTGKILSSMMTIAICKKKGEGIKF